MTQPGKGKPKPQPWHGVKMGETMTVDQAVSNLKQSVKAREAHSKDTRQGWTRIVFIQLEELFAAYDYQEWVNLYGSQGPRV
jgi:hypothetical protein